MQHLTIYAGLCQELLQTYFLVGKNDSAVIKEGCLKSESTSCGQI